MIKSQLLGSIYGFIIGDALGVPVEFLQRNEFNITDMVGYGTYEQPKGTWSDDSSLMLCLIENINENGSYDSLMKKFSMYKKEGYMTPFNYMFDIGISTEKAITSFDYGYSPLNCGGITTISNGNGGIMRISPLAFSLAYIDDFKKRSEITMNYSSLTHKHPISLIGAVIFVEVLYGLSKNKDLKILLKEIKENIKNLTFENYDDSEIKQSYLNYVRIFSENLEYREEKTISSSGFVVDTLESALWCVLTTRNYKDAVLKAVNLGEDTDTIGAITGAIAGIIYGYDSIPKEWLDELQNKNLLERHINPFVKKYST